MEHTLSTQKIKNLILQKLSHNFGLTDKDATYEYFYKATALVVKDILLKERAKFINIAKKQEKKQVYYICMEFLIGRSLKNNLFNLGLEKSFTKALSELGVNIERVYEQEPDAGLGNGGLGRLAACFLDALASNSVPATGYCLRYEYGIFSQKLIDGWQTELPEFWLPGGEVWLQPHKERSVEVLFNGNVEESWDGEHHLVEIKNATKVNAVPYDLMIAGFNNNGVSKLRLWAAESLDFDMELFNSGDYVRATEQKAMSEIITKVLYPDDNHLEGKSLRLSQQYFLVSATIQDIVRRHLKAFNTLDNFADQVVIHLNDTHPILAIPELMRIMLDECGFEWEKAFNIVKNTFAYTNHTVMQEALECWSQDLLKQRLPRIYQIIEELNRRFCQEMHSKGIDGYQVGRMAILNDGIVKMANLALACCYSINGVSELHSNILKNNVFKDFYQVMPEKFKNITNGIAHRRWLNQANPKLANFLDELIGKDYIFDASHLHKLSKYKDDKNVLEKLAQIKYENKLRLADYVKRNGNLTIDPSSIFDVQVKRLHEYKRQHLNALNILSTYLWLKENPNKEFMPKTYIFGAKAAPGYYFAKQIIRFIVKLAEIINNDPQVNDKLKVIYLENYNVTLAELLIPAAEISEQISLAGTEASGTGNMKFMLNGAITIGTLDGANIEMSEAMGPENMIIFGMKSKDVKELERTGYNPKIYYNNNPLIKKAIDKMNTGINNLQFSDIAYSLTSKDPYMVLADFADYHAAQEKASNLYLNKYTWNQMSLMNIANSGFFAADRAIHQYINDIWHVSPINKSQE